LIRKNAAAIGSPRSQPGVAPGFEERTQFTDVARRAAVFEAKMGENTLGSAFGGPGE
jgi:hypothetical protein